MNVSNEQYNTGQELDNVQPTSIVNRTPADIRNGESVEYAPMREWYAVRTTYGRARKGDAFFKEHGYETFFPTKTRKAIKYIDGKPTLHYVNEPLLSNIFFVRAYADTLKRVFRDAECPSYVTPYYNHCNKDNQGRNPFMKIPEIQMKNFMTLLKTKNEHIILADPNNQKFSKGQLVRVTNGEFKGVIGRVARHKGQQRVFVNIENLCMVATAYIPTPYLEIIT